MLNKASVESVLQASLDAIETTHLRNNSSKVVLCLKCLSGTFERTSSFWHQRRRTSSGSAWSTSARRPWRFGTRKMKQRRKTLKSRMKPSL